MSRTNSDEQLQFLLSCIRYSNNGKVGSSFHLTSIQQLYLIPHAYNNADTQQVDFTEVAKECKIVSKGAA